MKTSLKLLVVLMALLVGACAAPAANATTEPTEVPTQPMPSETASAVPTIAATATPEVLQTTALCNGFEQQTTYVIEVAGAQMDCIGQNSENPALPYWYLEARFEKDGTEMLFILSYQFLTLGCDCDETPPWVEYHISGFNLDTGAPIEFTCPPTDMPGGLNDLKGYVLRGEVNVSDSADSFSATCSGGGVEFQMYDSYGLSES